MTTKYLILTEDESCCLGVFDSRKEAEECDLIANHSGLGLFIYEQTKETGLHYTQR